MIEQRCDQNNAIHPDCGDGVVYLPASLASPLADIRQVQLTDEAMNCITLSLKEKLYAINQQHGTRLTLSRVQHYFEHFCQQKGISEPASGVIRGEPLGHHSGSYYIRFKVEQIPNIQRRFADHLDGLAGQKIFALPYVNVTGTWGSNRVLDVNSIKKYFYRLWQSCLNAYERGEFVEAHNFYTLYAVGLLQLSTGHRPEIHAFGCINDFDLYTQHVFIDDKKSGSNHCREIPLTMLATQQVLFYLEHLHALRAVTCRLGTSIPKTIERILAGRENLFCLIEDKEFCIQAPLKHAKKYTDDLLCAARNFYRHVLRTHLEELNQPTDLMDWFMGHEGKRDHSASRYSAFNNQDFRFIVEQVEAYLVNVLGLVSFKSPLVG